MGLGGVGGGGTRCWEIDEGEEGEDEREVGKRSRVSSVVAAMDGFLAPFKG